MDVAPKTVFLPVQPVALVRRTIHMDKFTLAMAQVVGGPLAGVLLQPFSLESLSVARLGWFS